MLAAVKVGEIDCVICYKLDRISRNVGDFAQTYETFEKHSKKYSASMTYCEIINRLLGDSPNNEIVLPFICDSK